MKEEKKILILEDDIIVGIDLQEVLIANGYTTSLVHNYEQALAEAKLFKPQLAICDINLGKGLTGIDFVKDVYILPRFHTGSISPYMAINHNALLNLACLEILQYIRIFRVR